MTQRLPRATADDAIRALERAGFALVRQSGGHRVYRNTQGQRATVPYHRGRTLHPKVLASILRDAGLSIEQFRGLLRG